MARWAELDNNNIVLRVTVGSNDDPDEGYQWLIDNLGGRWVKTSYNSRGGKRINPETNEIVSDDHFRYNYAGIGYYYDEAMDAFIPPKPFDSWTLDNNSATWMPPVEYPNDGEVYTWDEDSASWMQVNNLINDQNSDIL